MDWLTFTAELANALAWPVAFAVVLLYFRKPILDLLPLLRQFKAFGFEANFEQQARQIREGADQVLVGKPKAQLPSEAAGTEAERAEAQEPASIIDKVLEHTGLFTRNPRDAIVIAWDQVEAILGTAARSYGGKNPDETIGKLLGGGVINTAVFELYVRLSVLRYSMDTSPAEFVPSVRAARDFVESADRVRRAIEVAIKLRG